MYIVELMLKRSSKKVLDIEPDIEMLRKSKMRSSIYGLEVM
jgi:hypothetical protein